LVCALAECWNLNMKTFQISQTEVLFLVYDVALLIGSHVIRKQVTFKHREGACKVKEVLKGAIDDRLTQERRRTNEKEICLYRNYVSVIVG